MFIHIVIVVIVTTTRSATANDYDEYPAQTQQYLQHALARYGRESCVVSDLAPVITDYVSGVVLASGQYVPSGTLVRQQCLPGEQAEAGSLEWDICDNGIWRQALKRVLSTGQTDDLFVCSEHQGGCGPPHVPHANLTSLLRRRLNFDNGTNIKIECASDSVSFHSPLITCRNGRWISKAPLDSICMPVEFLDDVEKDFVATETPGEDVEIGEAFSDYCVVPYVAGAYTLHVTKTQINHGQYSTRLYETITNVPLDIHSKMHMDNGYNMVILCDTTHKPPSVGDTKLKCRNGDWIAEQGWPNCRASCVVVPLANTQPEQPVGSTVAHGNKVRYWCPPRLFINNARRYLKAQCVNGQWSTSSAQFKCVSIYNSVRMRRNTNTSLLFDDSSYVSPSSFTAPCNTPFLTNSEDYDSNGELMLHGDYYQVRCLSGYRVVGDEWLLCQHGQWKYKNSWPKCKRSLLKHVHHIY